MHCTMLSADCNCIGKRSGAGWGSSSPLFKAAAVGSLPGEPSDLPAGQFGAAGSGECSQLPHSCCTRNSFMGCFWEELELV